VGGGSVTTRSARRRARNAPIPRKRTFLERYGVVLVAAFAIAGVALIAYAYLSGSATQAGYTCDSLLTPGPTEPLATPRPSLPTLVPSPTPSATPSPTAAPSGSASASGSPAASESTSPSTEPSASPSAAPTPEPSPTQRLGFPTLDLNNRHVSPSDHVDYAFCPPTSGDHFSIAGGIAPLTRAFYGPDKPEKPGNWIHNLEHGGVVILYKGTPSKDILDSMKTVMDSAPASSKAATCGVPNQVIVVRFDDMNTPFAVVAWDRAMLLDTWNPDLALTFAQQWQDSPAIPEKAPATC
jgi:hypothetical protein